MHQVGVQTKGIAEKKSVESGLELIAQAGFDCVDINLDVYLTNSDLYSGTVNAFFNQSEEELEGCFAVFKEAMERYGLRPSQMHAPYPVMVPGRKEQNQYMAEQVIPKSLHIASFLGVPYVVIHPWKLQYRTSRRDEWEENREYFSSLIPLARKYEVVICLENLYEGLGSRLVEGVGGDISQMIRMIEELNREAGEERFGFCLDTGHLNLIRRDPRAVIRELGSHLKILHLHDNDGWGDLHQLPFTFGMEDGGRGVDWTGVLEGLGDICYEGVLSFETYPSLGSFPEALIPAVLRAIERTGRYFSSVLEGRNGGTSWK